MSISPIGYSSAVISFNSSGDNTLVAASTGQSIRVYKLWLVVTGATALTFKDGTTAISGAASMTASGAMYLPTDVQIPHFRTTPGNALKLNSSNAVQVSGMIYYELNNV